MKNILIDTHIFIWLLYEPKKITAKIAELVKNADIVYLSRISLMELTIKQANSKLDYSLPELLRGVKVLNLNVMELNDSHLIKYGSVILKHRDPFDYMLIAQTLAEGLEFVTADKLVLEAYPKVTINAQYKYG